MTPLDRMSPQALRAMADDLESDDELARDWARLSTARLCRSLADTLTCERMEPT